MKVTRKLKQLTLKSRKKLVKAQKRAVKQAFRLVFRNSHSIKARMVLKMEAHVAIFRFAKFVLMQFKIRPRLRFVSFFMIALMLAFAVSNRFNSYVKTKEPEIKINGQTILVAGAAQEKPKENLEISQAVSVKRSPFDFNKPVEYGYISQSYSSYHRAIDIATGAIGIPIRPLGKGRVEFAGWVADGKGNIVVVDHGDGLKSLYAHMGTISVGVGDQIGPETVIGTVGLTGHTTGAHVHLEIHDNEKMIDPASVLPDFSAMQTRP